MEVTNVHSLPSHVLTDHILPHIINDAKHPKDIMTLFEVAKADKTLHQLLTKSEYSTETLWPEAWRQATKLRLTAIAELAKCNSKHRPDIRNVVRLAGTTGCMLCSEAERTRKVLWEFGVRCCSDCLRDNTLSEFVMENELDLPERTWDHLPHVTKAMFNPYWNKAYDMRIFWWSDVLQVFRGFYKNRFGTFEDYKAFKSVEENRRLEQVKMLHMEKARIRQRRKDAIDALCGIHAPKSVCSELQLSQTYRRNCKIARPLDEKAFLKNKLPCIVAEVELSQ